MSETIRATLTRLAARLDAVENLIGHNGGPPLEDEIAEGSSQDRKLSKRELARRWGRSTRSIDRMRQRPDFVAGELVNGRWFFWLSAVQRYERDRYEAQLGSKAPDRSGYLRAASAPPKRRSPARVT
jgi:hypothetical protein